MGATAAAEAALRYPHTLGGLVMLNGWLAPGAREAFAAGNATVARALVSHSTQDEQVGYDCGEAAAQILQGAGVQTDFETQPGLSHVASGFDEGKLLAIDFFGRVMGHEMGSRLRGLCGVGRGLRDRSVSCMLLARCWFVVAARHMGMRTCAMRIALCGAWTLVYDRALYVQCAEITVVLAQSHRPVRK
jgi:pimeloyl-ACP methyl ester carboxylesterase